MTHPTQIGQDIDAAIMIVEELIIEGVNNV
jgi:hypothetical protein